MSDMVSGPPKTVQQSHTLRSVRKVNLNEERSDEKRHLAELEEHMRKTRRNRARQDRPENSEEHSPEEPLPEDPERARETDDSEQTGLSQDGHIDFTV